MTRKFIVILAFFALPLTSHGQPQNIKDAIDVIVLFCVAGGERIEVSGDANLKGEIAIKKFGAKAEGGITISKSEARGLVNGLNQELSKITAEQASEARKCMQPYIDKILNLIIGSQQEADTIKTASTDNTKTNSARLGADILLKFAFGTKRPEITNLIINPDYTMKGDKLFLKYKHDIFGITFSVTQEVVKNDSGDDRLGNATLFSNSRYVESSVRSQGSKNGSMKKVQVLCEDFLDQIIQRFGSPIATEPETIEFLPSDSSFCTNQGQGISGYQCTGEGQQTNQIFRFVLPDKSNIVMLRKNRTERFIALIERRYDSNPWYASTSLNECKISISLNAPT